MAGEWIPIDIGLDEKPETLELLDVTGLSVEVVTYRLRKLWGWVSMNSDDGTVRATPGRLARMWGGDPDFWQAVETVGWIRFSPDGTAEIPGWGRRFSQSAKARALHLERAGRARQAIADGAPKRTKSARGECAGAHEVSALERTRGEERTIPPPPPPDVAVDGETLRAAWNAAARAHPARMKTYGGDTLPAATLERLAEPGWLQEALEAIQRLPGCRFFANPVPLAQFSGAKAGRRFTTKVLEQEFDDPRRVTASAGHRPGDDRRPAAEAASEWARGASEQAARRQAYLDAKAAKGRTAEPGDADEDLERTKADMIRKLREGAA